jgi:hypothetical protein
MIGNKYAYKVIHASFLAANIELLAKVSFVNGGIVAHLGELEVGDYQVNVQIRESREVKYHM